MKSKRRTWNITGDTDSRLIHGICARNDISWTDLAVGILFLQTVKNSIEVGLVVVDVLRNEREEMIESQVLIL